MDVLPSLMTSQATPASSAARAARLAVVQRAHPVEQVGSEPGSGGEPGGCLRVVASV